MSQVGSGGCVVETGKIYQFSSLQHFFGRVSIDTIQGALRYFLSSLFCLSPESTILDPGFVLFFNARDLVRTE